MDEQYLADEFQMKNAISSFSSADRQRGTTADESRNILKDYFDKILLYSAGGFAFQISFLQFITDKHILSKTVFLKIPNIYVMYISMACYLVAGILVLFSRRFDAYYISANSAENYVKKYIEKQESILKMFEKYPGHQIVAGGPEMKILSLKEDIRLLKEVLPVNERGNKFWYGMMKFSAFTTEVLAGIATILLFIAVTQLTQNLVW